LRIWPADLEPKLVTAFREGYSPAQFSRDALSGVVVGIVALPLAIAFAIASGVRPEQGLYTAVVAGLIISALGGSRVQIGGPTGAFVVIVAGVVENFGYDGLATATLMAGVMLVVMGIARLGDVIRFIPYPVTVGFTTGIALIIATSQIRDALGLPMEHVPYEFHEKWIAYAGHLRSVDAPAALLCAASVVVIWLWPRVTTRVPGTLVALLAATAAAPLLSLDVDTIGSRFGEVPSSLPSPRLPNIEWGLLAELSSPAIAIALLAGIESLLSALVADGMIGGRHRSNAELVGQGFANIVSPLFYGIPATGAIARTATNVRNGGRTPVAGIVHALTLLVVLMAAGRWAALIPMPALAAILLVVAYNMSEWRAFARLLRGPRSDVLVLFSTFLLTVIVDLTVAIQVGVVLASLLFMRRMAEVTQVKSASSILGYGEGEEMGGPLPELPHGVEVFEIHGTFCFGAARKFSELVSSRQTKPAVVILRMRNVLAMDATGLHALETVASRFRQQGTVLLLSGVHAQPLVVMTRSGALDRIGVDHLFGTLREAVGKARELVEPKEEKPEPEPVETAGGAS
jgi:SulP family sulfate permease